MTPAEEIDDLLSELAHLMERLGELFAEPVADPTQGSAQHHKVTGSPEPWHKEAAAAYFDAHAGLRRIEGDLIYVVSGASRPGRPGSDVHTRAASAAIRRLVRGVPDELARIVRDELARWVEAAKQVGDIGEAERWAPIHVPRGQLPPACPHCGTFSLRVAVESRRVMCWLTRCVDDAGRRPQGHLERSRYNLDTAVIRWVDGSQTYYREAT
ncbi:hypothetical protein [Nonomuraea soli]|uniref:Uncharacterized protein n=1 Tax=Nonomuraea soli TaxID=1032476 RepID=A0A7W0CUF0_9ACTN|nr:hypothetical protein [Nonomuraea soli]MBA2897378.1 hypothetical protein [Nonomuraea soli]